MDRSLRVIASANGRAAPVAVIVTGSPPGVSRSPRPRSPPAPASRRLDKRIAIIPLDTQPAEQQEAEPGNVVDQRGAPDRVALAAGKDAGEIMQLAQLRSAFESLGFELGF